MCCGWGRVRGGGFDGGVCGEVVLKGVCVERWCWWGCVWRGGVGGCVCGEVVLVGVCVFARV